MISDADRERFAAARDEAIAREKAAGGIGQLNERTLHAAVKLYLAPGAENREVRVGRRTADVFGESGVVEIQTRSWEKLLPKLAEFLPVTDVTAVLPVAVTRRVWWTDPGTGAVSGGRKSPVTGTAFSALEEIAKLGPWLDHPSLTVRVMFFDVDDYRVRTVRRGRASSVRTDRVPADLRDECFVRSVADLAALLPPGLPEEFTAADLRRLGRVRAVTAGRIASALLRAGLTERLADRGRAYVYRIRTK